MLRSLDRCAADDRIEETPGRLDVLECDERRRLSGQGADPTAGYASGKAGETPQ
jgi:hypothetical protein